MTSKADRRKAYRDCQYWEQEVAHIQLQDPDYENNPKFKEAQEKFEAAYKAWTNES